MALFARERLSEIRGTPGDGILVGASASGFFQRRLKLFWRSEVREPLRQIYRSALHGHPGHAPNDRFRETSDSLTGFRHGHNLSAFRAASNRQPGEGPHKTPYSGLPGGEGYTPQPGGGTWRILSLGIDREERPMLWTIAVVLIVLWLLGLISSYTMGGFIHILLVIAIVVVLVRVIQGG